MTKQEIAELEEKDFIDHCETAIYLDCMNTIYNPYTDEQVKLFFNESERRRGLTGKSIYSIAYKNIGRQLGY